MSANSNNRGKQWVVKSNRYIEAKFTNYKPTLAQNRLVLWLASQVHSTKDEVFEEVVCSPSDLRSIMGVGYSNERLIEELVILRSATAVMKQGSKWSIFGIIDKAELDEDEGVVKLCLNDDMKPFLLKIGGKGEGFTRIELERIQSMRSVHSQRIYELLYQYKNVSRDRPKTIMLNTLKEHLGLKGKKSGVAYEKFKTWGEFERNVLRQAEKDLCNAGMFIHYDPVKTGRKITGVNFFFSIQKDGDGEILSQFLKLQLTGLSDYEKTQVANCNSTAEIEKAIIESDKIESLKPLRNLIPKTRTEFKAKVAAMLSKSLGE